MNNSIQMNGNGSHRRNRIIASPRARRMLRLRELDAALIRGTGPNGRIVASDVSDYIPAAPPVPEAKVARELAPSRDIAQLWHEVDATRLLQSFESYAKLAEKHHKVELSLSDLLLQILATSLRVCSEANLLHNEGDWQEASSPAVGLALGKNSVKVLEGTKRANLVEISRWRETSTDSETKAASTLHIAKSPLVDKWAAAPKAGQSSALTCGHISKRAFVVGDELAVVPTLHLCLSYDTEALEFETAVEFLSQIVSFIEDPNLLSVL